MSAHSRASGNPEGGSKPLGSGFREDEQKSELSGRHAAHAAHQSDRRLSARPYSARKGVVWTRV